MNVEETIDSVIDLPRKFRDLGNTSLYDLLRSTGYFDNYTQVSVRDIRDALSRHPNLWREWVILSENKRTSEGWYFEQGKHENYYVGYLSLKGNGIDPEEYSDPLDACAVFIKREIEDIRT